ncbi:MAG TPA: hypothetical protein VKW08_03420 [Xanthobacteraceae bacterium]|nr:hypothetical protein [Xanthobacteraceae bacterium]
MRHLHLVAAAIISAILAGSFAARAFDDAPYPDWKGHWSRTGQKFPGQPSYDGSKPPGRGQQAPLTAEYQAVYDANEADQRSGGFGTTTGWWCNAWGMPAMMMAFQPMEIVITPGVTYMLTSDTQFTVRRIFTDGRDWPAEFEPSYRGLSMGKWRDEQGSGRYDTLLIETRGFKGPRVYDASGIPLHADNQSIITERLSLDRSDRNLLHDEITVIDHALTRPWTVTKSYRRDSDPRAIWTDYVCEDGQSHVKIGNESYYLSADGLLMPTAKNQPPPDLRYFKNAKSKQQ